MPEPAAPRVALVPGSFDPITNGHLDVITRARALFDRVIVGVLVNPDKAALLSLDERLALVAEAVGEPSGVLVRAFDGLLVDAARAHGVDVVVRGLRAASDFDAERPMAHMNAALLPGLDTIFLASSPRWAHVSSRLVREIHRLGGPIEAFVPPAVLTHLQRRAPMGSGAPTPAGAAQES